MANLSLVKMTHEIIWQVKNLRVLLEGMQELRELLKRAKPRENDPVVSN